jgi:hypothetical protein
MKKKQEKNDCQLLTNIEDVDFYQSKFFETQQNNQQKTAKEK